MKYVNIENKDKGSYRVMVVGGATIEASGITTPSGTVPVFSQARRCKAWQL